MLLLPAEPSGRYGLPIGLDVRAVVSVGAIEHSDHADGSTPVDRRSLLRQPTSRSDAQILSEIGGALAELHHGAGVTVVVGVEARGFIVGPLVALYLGVGFAEIRYDVHLA